jgi:RNA polymerase sigma factor (sigma-70 family)
MHRSSAARKRRQDDFVLDTIRDNAASMLRVARKYSVCSADAEDAYQRTIEIFLRRVDNVERSTAGAWLRTVVKHEALAVRDQRQRHGVTAEEVDFDQQISTRQPDEGERLQSFDQMERAAEALEQLKPQEVRALVLKAKGYSYQEIADMLDWTYTKVNRCITEGRKAFLERCSAIERGDECRRFEPVLSALADGEATPKQLVEVRAHLRHCTACRATVREFHLASHRAAALVPIAAVAGTPHALDAGAGFLSRVYEIVVGGVTERATMSVARIQTMADAAAGSKAAAVAASAAALAGGGVGVQQAATAAKHERPATVVSDSTTSKPTLKPAARPQPVTRPVVAATRAENRPKPARADRSQDTPRSSRVPPVVADPASAPAIETASAQAAPAPSASSSDGEFGLE